MHLFSLSGGQPFQRAERRDFDRTHVSRGQKEHEAPLLDLILAASGLFCETRNTRPAKQHVVNIFLSFWGQLEANALWMLQWSFFCKGRAVRWSQALLFKWFAVWAGPLEYSFRFKDDRRQDVP